MYARTTIHFGPRGSDVGSGDRGGHRATLCTFRSSETSTSPMRWRAAAAAWALGSSPDTIAQRLSDVPQVPGRLEMLHDAPDRAP